MNTLDCVIVGGGPAGLSAALVLGRARRRTLLVDAGHQSNLPASRIGGLLGFDGRPPGELYAAGRRELRSYPSVDVVSGEVICADVTDSGFSVELRDGRRECTRRILLATGVDYQTPDLPGAQQLWGTSVFHCPFCHGWEFRDQPLAVLADGDKAVHAALLIRGWTDDVVVLSNDVDSDGRELLAAAGVAVDDRAVTGVQSHDGRLSAVVFDDGSRLERSGLLVATTLRQRGDLAQQLGVFSHGSGPVVTNPVDVDKLGRTTVAGVFAAGDLCSQTPQVAAAIAAGSVAATAIVESLLANDVGLPFPPRSE